MFIREIWRISKFQKSELGKFIQNFPLKHIISSTNKSVPHIEEIISFSIIRYSRLLLTVVLVVIISYILFVGLS